MSFKEMLKEKPKPKEYINTTANGKVYYTDTGTSDNIMFKIATKRLEKSEIDNYIESLAKTSEYKRFMYRIITGKVWRGSNIELEKNLDKTVKNIKEFQEFKRGSAGDFKLVMNEFQELLKKRKELVDK